MKNPTLAPLLLFIAVQSCFGWKSIAHFASLPVIEGAGIYSSVTSLQHADLGVTKGLAVGNLALIGTNMTMGVLSKLGPIDSRNKFRKVHRVVGVVVSAAALGLSVATSADHGLDSHKWTRYSAYGYTGLSLVPVIMFSF